jgi:excisionase family DNA binding protein
MENATQLPPILTVADIRAYLGVSRQTAYEIVNRNDFPKVRFGKLIRISRDTFLRWFEQQSEQSL